MNNNQNRLIDLKISILQLAQEMGNIVNRRHSPWDLLEPELSECG
jgi:hypothetical protein